MKRATMYKQGRKWIVSSWSEMDGMWVISQEMDFWIARKIVSEYNRMLLNADIESGCEISVIRWNRTHSKVLVSYHDDHGQPATRWLTKDQAIALSDGLMML